MPIRFACECGEGLKAVAGERATCPACGGALLVPRPKPSREPFTSGPRRFVDGARESIDATGLHIDRLSGVGVFPGDPDE